MRMSPGFQGFPGFFQGIQEKVNLQTMDILYGDYVGTVEKTLET
jgi:hypothetical protein